MVWSRRSLLELSAGTFGRAVSHKYPIHSRGIKAPTPVIGKFYLASGKIVAPDGSYFIAKGINIADWAAVGGGGSGDIGDGTKTVDSNDNPIAGQDGMQVFRLFPRVTMVRLNCQWQSGQIDSSGYNDSPRSLETFIKNLTSAKVVVIIEDHVGKNQIPSGGSYNAEMQWYANMAKYYKDNPYVWFGTMNEPWGPYPGSQICQQELDIYNAIRNTGNHAPILMAINSPNDARQPWVGQGAYFKNMRNVGWDVHTYALMDDGPHTQAEVNSSMANILYQLQQGHGIFSADGVMPVIIGEYGTSVNGAGVDVNGTKTVLAVQTSSASGSCAWTWAAGTYDRLQRKGYLTAFGKEVNQYFSGNPPASWTSYDNS
jgi:hypothetical protein